MIIEKGYHFQKWVPFGLVKSHHHEEIVMKKAIFFASRSGILFSDPVDGRWGGPGKIAQGGSKGKGSNAERK
jgi:hypothetical protein